MMGQIETKNAKIDSLFLGIEDHGIPTCFIGLDYGDYGHQGFGGYDLRYYGIEFITKILETVGVDEWSKLKGKNVRVKATPEKVSVIGNIVENKWFEPEKDLKRNRQNVEPDKMDT